MGTPRRSASTDQRESVDVSALKEQIGDQWLDMLKDLAPQLDGAIDNLGRLVMCPVHGGTDGFRIFEDAADTGGGACNTCGTFADGFALLEWANDWSHQETFDAVHLWLTDSFLSALFFLGGGKCRVCLSPGEKRGKEVRGAVQET